MDIALIRLDTKLGRNYIAIIRESNKDFMIIQSIQNYIWSS